MMQRGIIPRKETDMNIGDKVKYSHWLPDDAGVTYIIIEIDTARDWCKLAADVDMAIKPTYTANLSDLVLA